MSAVPPNVPAQPGTSHASSDSAEATVFSVDKLLKYMGNDDKAHALVSKIVRDACAPGMAPLDEAHAAMATGGWTSAGKILHGLRGSIGTLGAKRLVAASLALEQALADADTQAHALPGLFAAVEQEYKAVLEQAGTWLSRHDSGAV